MHLLDDPANLLIEDQESMRIYNDSMVKSAIFVFCGGDSASGLSLDQRYHLQKLRYGYTPHVSIYHKIQKPEERKDLERVIKTIGLDGFSQDDFLALRKKLRHTLGITEKQGKAKTENAHWRN